MASELQADYLTGKNVYFLLRNSTGSVWNGSSFVAYNTANYTDYDIAATEQGTASGYYAANMPSVSQGVYYAVAKERAGGTPAETDVTVGTGTINWGGSAVAVPNDLADAILKRDMSAVTGESARSLLNAIRKLMNKWSISGSTLTVYKEDDATSAYTQSIGTTAGADPITSLDTQ